MTAKEFLAAFPQVKRNQSTGGGCTAWEVELPLGAYVLITDGVDACQPELTACKACFGVDWDCSGSVEPRVLTWLQAAAWLCGVLDASEVFASIPKKGATP